VNLTEELERAARELRLGHVAAGCDAFGRCADELARLLALPANADGAAQLLPYLQEALAAQERADWLALADVLQYELAERLE